MSKPEDETKLTNKKLDNLYSDDILQYTEMNYSSSGTPSTSKGPEEQKQQTLVQSQHAEYCVSLAIPFRELCIGTLLLPLCSMFICFTTAYIFQPNDIHETHCRVYNIIPSISAITGISPQRYLWRISIAIHVGPRFLIAFAYRNFYRQVLAANALHIGEPQVRKASKLINVLFWLSLIEITALTAMHEKIFITFMTASLFYMLLTIILWNTLYPNGPPTPEEVRSLKMKKIFFALSVLSAISLVIFFAKHRFLCHDMAFSWFATSEYLVALFNMANHITSVFEFSNNHLMITRNTIQLQQSVSTTVGDKIITRTLKTEIDETVTKKID
uniref:CSON015277 protein n=1 Tax=Culicoides sonorensis TaxID=179676 RepID=A0A336MCW7_CULSO